MSARYIIGIDLGTTNCVLAYASADEEGDGEIKVLPVPQLTAANTIDDRQSLASFVYLAPDHEAGSLDLPWAKDRKMAVGEIARSQSAAAPERTVGAAKSWLCHSKVDRHQPILPWNAPPEVAKISPITASRYYLEHLMAAWAEAFPDAPIAEQTVVLTVPASFDVSARELTREAAREAGLPEDTVLLEEPQAATYAWLAVQGDAWRKKLKVDDQLLICDVGGGTTDLTLVSVAEEEGDLVLQRLAVGSHLLVGGDNMDLALAHFVAAKFAKQGTNLDPWQSVSLWHSCRAAKEALLAAEGDETFPISVLGRGKKLIGGTVTCEVNRKEVSKLLVEGFLPKCELTDQPQKRRASGFQEIGLPFETDTAITKHLAAFLQLHQSDGDSPGGVSHVLFNGGVFRAAALKDRLLKVLGDWFPEAPPQTLVESEDLDYSVARGAAYYGLVKQQGGMRIRGGTSRAYYVGVETAGLAIPGAPRPLNALCVVPFGMEEGAECDVPSAEIGLVLGEPAHFRFFSSPVRKEDQPGAVLSHWSEDELAETDSLEATLPAGDAADDAYVPVQFQSRVTELGVLELWCVEANGNGQWKLEFSVRDDQSTDE